MKPNEFTLFYPNIAFQYSINRQDADVICTTTISSGALLFSWLFFCLGGWIMVDMG